MTHFVTKLQQKLSEYNAWASSQEASSCRLVHYCGVDLVGAVDVPLAQVASRIAGCLSEGFVVLWCLHNYRIFLSVQEPDGPVPPWDKVFAEAPLANVTAILRMAGFADGV